MQAVGEGLSGHRIALNLGISRNTVHNVVKRHRQAG
ncbi:MAG: helix-turn-helix domain containing protein [Albidovulum sp.]|nr:helix-turn-helix domain containing protein [Albidovulum sp.]